MSLAGHLEDIYRQYNELTPARVVAVARDASHPLHDRFEWDDAIAGEKWRERQAAKMIRSIRLVEPVGDREQVRVRSWHSVPRPEGHSYVPLGEIRQDPFMRQVVLNHAEREWRALYQKYQHLAEFLNVVRRDVAS